MCIHVSYVVFEWSKTNSLVQSCSNTGVINIVLLFSHILCRFLKKSNIPCGLRVVSILLTDYNWLNDAQRTLLHHKRLLHLPVEIHLYTKFDQNVPCRLRAISIFNNCLRRTHKVIIMQTQGFCYMSFTAVNK